MTSFPLADLQKTALELFSASCGIFWAFLPLAFLLSILVIYITGEITGARFEALIKRTVLAIMLLVAFPQISAAFVGIESYLVSAFGGDQSYQELFGRIGKQASQIGDGSGFSWLKLGQVSLGIVATVSYLILWFVQKFLDVLHLATWNLLHILGPIALLGTLFPSFSQVPKGIFLGMFELSLWKPVWVILCRIFLSIGFGSAPPNPSQWMEAAIMNFAVAAIMARTPSVVHGFLSGTIASVGGGTMQTMIGGVGAFLANTPMKAIKGGLNLGSKMISGGMTSTVNAIRREDFRQKQRHSIRKPEKPKKK